MYFIDRKMEATADSLAKDSKTMTRSINGSLQKIIDNQTGNKLGYQYPNKQLKNS